MNVKAGDVILVKEEKRNSGYWQLGVVESAIQGGDGVVRAVQLRSRNSLIERPIQLLYPLDLSSDAPTRREATLLNAEGREQRPR